MYQPQEYGIILLLMLVSMLCWGSWANTLTLCPRFPFQLFYWDYSIGLVLGALLWGFTFGSTGVYIDCVDSAPIEIPAMKVLAVDTTAAGDTYNGAFATGLMNGEEVAACAKFASASAAVSVTRIGAQASMPTLAESTALLKSVTI